MFSQVKLLVIFKNTSFIEKLQIGTNCFSIVIFSLIIEVLVCELQIVNVCLYWCIEKRLHQLLISLFHV